MADNLVTIDTLRRAYRDAEAAGDFEILPPVHPGEILREEYLVPLDMTAGQLAKALDLPRSRIERIVKEEIGISTDTAFRLARFFRTSPGLWTNLQTEFERETLLREIGPESERIEPITVPKAA